MRLAFALLVLLTAWTIEARATDYPAEVVRVVDGDTVDVRLHVYPNPPIYIDERVRLAGINTAEVKTKRECEFADAEQARHFVEQWIDKHVGLVYFRWTSRRTYGRAVGHLVAEGGTLSDALLAAGLAVEYDGRTKRKTWRCQR